MEKVYLALYDWYQDYIDDHIEGTEIIGVYAKAEDAKKAIFSKANDRKKNLTSLKFSVLEEGWIIEMEDDNLGQFRYRVLEMTVN